jgi:hypothetical protein
VQELVQKPVEACKQELVQEPVEECKQVLVVELALALDTQAKP